MPEAVDPWKSRIKAYGKALIRTFEGLTSLELDFHRWIDQSKYSRKEKEYFKRLWQETISWDESMFKNKSFIKDEGYDAFKAARAINSYSDALKALLGCITHCVDKKFFSQGDFFVKGTDPKTWPDLLIDEFDQVPGASTDFTSMEAHHQGIYMELVRYWYMHMIRHALSNSLKRKFSRVMGGTNVCEFGHITVKLTERLMSGAHWTSSSNALLNLIICSFLWLTTRHDMDVDFDAEAYAKEVRQHFRGRFEGDDGLFAISKKIDTFFVGTKAKPSPLGLVLKIDYHDNAAEGGFCSKIFDITEKTVVTNPVKVIANFPQLAKKYAVMRPKKQDAMMRAKALSYLYLFPNHPIISEYCHWVLDNTRSVNVTGVTSEMDLYKRDLLDRALTDKVWNYEKPRPSNNTRMLVERTYGISVTRQLEIETAIKMNAGGSIYHDLRDIAKDEHLLYAAMYVTSHGKDINVPHKPIDMVQSVINGTRASKCKKSKYDKCDVRGPLPPC